jgi:hypothetical protein
VGIEGSFCARQSFYNINPPTEPGSFNFAAQFIIDDLDNFSEEMVVCKYVECRLDDLVFQSLFGWAYNFIHTFNTKLLQRAEKLKWTTPGYIKSLRKDIVAATASCGGSGPAWPWVNSPVTFLNPSADFQAQYGYRFKSQNKVPPLREGSPLAYSPFDQCHPDDPSLLPDLLPPTPTLQFEDFVQIPNTSDSSIDLSILSSVSSNQDDNAGMEGVSRT